MRFILLLAIRIYWLVPKTRRRVCLFKYSCSHYVYDVTKEKGLVEGLRALRRRSRQCRSGYAVYSTGEKEWVILKDTTVVDRGDMNV